MMTSDGKEPKHYLIRFANGEEIEIYADTIREGRDGVALYRDGDQIAKYRTGEIAGWRIAD